MNLIDIGVNLTNKRLYNDVDEVIQQAREVGVEQLVVTGTSIEHSRKAAELCRRYPGRLYCTAGVHPHDASDWNPQADENLRALLTHSEVRAVGETGLDFNRNYSPQDMQIEAFEAQMDIAGHIGKPLFLHQRDAIDPFIALLREHRDRLGPVVVHCFTDDRETLFSLLDLDCHIGITGWICDERRGEDLRESVPLIPVERLMIETDAPYLLPRDLPSPPADKTNRPRYLPHILERVAQLRNEDIDTLAMAIHRTTTDFFGL